MMKPKICVIYIQYMYLKFFLYSNAKYTQHNNQVQTEIAKQTKTSL